MGKTTAYKTNFWGGFRGKLLTTCAGVCVVTVSCVFFYMDQRQESLYMDSMLDQSRALFRQVVLTRKWISDHGGVFVEKLPWVSPNPYLAEKSVTATTGKKYMKKNPAMVTREISEYSRREGLYWFHITSLRPLNNDNRPDDFEAKALREFEGSGTREAWEILQVDKHKNFRYISPLFVEQSCLECHSHQGYKLGDIRGGISVTLPMDKYYSSLKKERLMMAGFVIFIAMFLMTSLYVALNMVIVSPVRTLREFALRWSRNADGAGDARDGESGKGCPSAPEFSKGDELYDLYNVLCELRTKVSDNHRNLQDKINLATRELARMNEELLDARDRYKKASDQKSVFIAGLSHELRTPLTSIKGAAGFIREKLGDGGFVAPEARDELAPFIEIICRNINRFVKLVEDTLDLEKIEAGQIELNIADMDMAELLEEARREFAHLASENGITISSRAEAPLPCRADPNRIFQVMSNLVINSLRHSPEGGKVVLGACSSNGDVLVSVSDEGPGIPPQEAQKIFELFHKGTKDGTGLGLTISKSIIEKHGGRIWVDGEGRGGSTFCFSLPRAVRNHG